MKKTQPLPPSETEYVAAAVAKAKAAYQKLTRTPRPVGRPPQHEQDHSAIAEIAKVNAGLSGPGFDVWTQAQWVEAVGVFRMETVPGEATIKKNLKTYLQRVPVPIQHIPASVVQAKPLNDQLMHWYGVAMTEAVLTAKPHAHAHVISIPFSMVDACHRALCAKHIFRALRPTEEQRLAWLRDKWRRAHTVPVTSRQPATSAPLTARRPKQS